MADLKKVYQAINEDEALNALLEFKEKWQQIYPSCVKSWKENWDILSTFFAYPAEVRKIIYTTNIIEGLNRQFRKITKNKPSFSNDDSLRKILYLASKNIVAHSAQPFYSRIQLFIFRGSAAVNLFENSVKSCYT